MKNIKTDYRLSSAQLFIRTHTRAHTKTRERSNDYFHKNTASKGRFKVCIKNVRCVEKIVIVPAHAHTHKTIFKI